MLSSVVMTPDQRREMAQALCEKLAQATAPVVFLLPLQGGNEWDRPGAPLNDPDGLAAFIDEMRARRPANVELRELDCHINDPGFSDAALEVVDAWIDAGLLPR